MMKKAKIKLHKTRAHRALFERDSPFRRPHIEENQRAYKRRSKHRKNDSSIY